MKNVFGSGFRLTLAKNESNFKMSEFQSLLASSMDSYSFDSNIAAELCVTIPFSLSPKLPALLSKIESGKGALGIDGYGISSPTIEEVFIK